MELLVEVDVSLLLHFVVFRTEGAHASVHSAFVVGSSIVFAFLTAFAFVDRISIVSLRLPSSFERSVARGIHGVFRLKFG